MFCPLFTHSLIEEMLEGNRPKRNKMYTLNFINLKFSRKWNLMKTNPFSFIWFSLWYFVLTLDFQPVFVFYILLFRRVASNKCYNICVGLVLNESVTWDVSLYLLLRGTKWWWCCCCSTRNTSLIKQLSVRMLNEYAVAAPFTACILKMELLSIEFDSFLPQILNGRISLSFSFSFSFCLWHFTPIFISKSRSILWYLLKPRMSSPR